MSTYCITFPMYHPLRDDWLEITAASIREARHAAFALFGRRYGSVYDLVDFLAFGRAHFRGGRVGLVIAARDIEPMTGEAGAESAHGGVA